MLLTKNNLWSQWIPFAILALYLLQTTPLMIPGSDVWLHLIRIENNSDGVWHSLWHTIMNFLGIHDLLYLANFIHKTQSLISFVLIFISAKLILEVIFYQSNTRNTAINIGAWLAVIFWTVMHGFFAGPIFASWFIVFANNYQIAYPAYFFGVASIIYALHLHILHRQKVKPTLLIAVAIACIIFTGVIHASDLPYFILASIFLALAFFQKKYIPIYLAITIVFMALIYTIFDPMPRTKVPTLFKIIDETPPNEFIHAISNIGQETLTSDYGFNTFNYFFIFAFASVIAIILLQKDKNNIPINQRLILFILLSSTPSLLYLTNFGAGLLGMITYPSLAYRFTWSSFLFLGPSILAIYLYIKLQKFKWVVILIQITALITIPLLSFKFEEQQVSYHYVRSLYKTLDPSNTRAGFSAEQSEWFENAYTKIVQANFKNPICVDIYTAQYLYFQKNYKNVILPSRRYRGTGIKVDKSLYRQCKYPIDGGTVFKDLGITSGPWSYRGW
jgi:hypothetical protein